MTDIDCRRLNFASTLPTLETCYAASQNAHLARFNASAGADLDGCWQQRLCTFGSRAGYETRFVVQASDGVCAASAPSHLGHSASLLSVLLLMLTALGA
jgi:hypothetical protein